MQKYIRPKLPNQKTLIEPDATHDLPIHGHCIVHTCINMYE